MEKFIFDIVVVHKIFEIRLEEVRESLQNWRKLKDIISCGPFLDYLEIS